ncbi:HlyD family efflux transporter periplasmic adaptor subunit [Streptomyces olivoverticillatus]
MQFRQKALSKLQSPEELDLPVRFARPQGRLVLAVTVVVMAAAGFWAFTGSVSSKLSAPGILTHAEGSYRLQSPYAGQVTQVLAEEGQLLSPGAPPLLRIGTDRGDRTVHAVAGGRVTTLVAKIGSVVTTGADVATVERVDNPDDPLVAMVYVPGGNGGSIPLGASVDLGVQSVPPSSATACCAAASRRSAAHPRHRSSSPASSATAQLAAQFAKQGNPVAVLVELERSAVTKSGYQWSSAGGPPYAVDSTTPVTAAVHLAAQHPVDWLLP